MNKTKYYARRAELIDVFVMILIIIVFGTLFFNALINWMG
jgi:hypothetical protein